MKINIKNILMGIVIILIVFVLYLYVVDDTSILQTTDQPAPTIDIDLGNMLTPETSAVVMFNDNNLTDLLSVFPLHKGDKYVITIDKEVRGLVVSDHAKLSFGNILLLGPTIFNNNIPANTPLKIQYVSS